MKGYILPPFYHLHILVEELYVVVARAYLPYRHRCGCNGFRRSTGIRDIKRHILQGAGGGILVICVIVVNRNRGIGLVVVRVSPGRGGHPGYIGLYLFLLDAHEAPV